MHQELPNTVSAVSSVRWRDLPTVSSYLNPEWHNILRWLISATNKYLDINKKNLVFNYFCLNFIHVKNVFSMEETFSPRKKHFYVDKIQTKIIEN